MTKGKKKNSSKSTIDGACELINIIEAEGGKCCIGRMHQTGNGSNGDISIKILGEMNNSIELKLYTGIKSFQRFRIMAPVKYDNAMGFLKYCISKTRIYMQ
ncbi:MAG: hypothetical protein NT139_00685 [Candidatus Woesearchaeota archaeon]|nr:hypothetical protein [Candidatus Woesearchaeota archaeon]